MPFQKDERNMRPTCEVPISRRTIVQDLSPPLVLRGQWALPGHKGQVQVCWQKGILWIKQLIYWMKLHVQKMKQLPLTPIGSSNGMVITMANKSRIQMTAASLLSPYCSSFKSRIQWFHNPIFADIFSSVPPLYLPTGSRSLYASAI